MWVEDPISHTTLAVTRTINLNASKPEVRAK
jgi:hypothetical protein